MTDIFLRAPLTPGDIGLYAQTGGTTPAATEYTPPHRRLVEYAGLRGVIQNPAHINLVWDFDKGRVR